MRGKHRYLMEEIPEGQKDRPSRHSPPHPIGSPRGRIVAIITVLLLSACAQRPLSTREQGFLGGAALGAGTGAIIGSATGHAGTGAAIGGALGGLTGAFLGGELEAREPVSRGSVQQPVLPQRGSQTSGLIVGPSTGSTQANPTFGRFVNGTPWRVEVFVDGHGGSTRPIVLRPGGEQAYSLELGPHRVMARAVDTSFGQRVVGNFDRTVRIDPRGNGWTLRFNQGDFR
ncbi:MAG: glycine zipper domain-containing protein [Candidatus Methylomirabilales bacterium]